MLNYYNNRALLSFIFFAFSCLMIFAQPPIPPNDKDIEGIIQKTNAFTELAQQCYGFDCPNFDCKTTQETFVHLQEAKIYMEHIHFWLDRAAETQMELLLNLAEQGKFTSERLKEVQTMYAFQKSVIKSASAVINVISAATNLKSLMTDPIAIKDMSFLEVIDNLDTLYEGLKSIESVDKEIHEVFGGKSPINTTMDLVTFGNDNINNSKTAISNFKSVIVAAHKNGDGWKSLFTSDTVRLNYLNMVGQWATSLGDHELKKREEIIAKWIGDLDAEGVVQQGIINDFERIRIRRKKAGDAAKILQDLLSITSGGAGNSLYECINRRRASCNISHSDIKIPEKHKIFDNNQTNSPKKHWGESLKYFNIKMIEVEKLLEFIPEISESAKPELHLLEKYYKPNEILKVQFKVPECNRDKLWVGIVPSSVISNGSEEVNRNKNIGRINFLKDEGKGELNFITPQKSDKYDLRMNNIKTGLEVMSISFEVSQEIGKIKMNAFDENDSEIEFHVGIYKNGKHITSINGIGLIQDLPQDTYTLKFLVEDKDIIKDEIIITKNNTTNVEVRLKKKPEIVPKDDNINLELFKNWLGTWSTNKGFVIISTESDGLVVKSQEDYGPSQILFTITSSTPKKITGTYKPPFAGYEGNFEWEIYNEGTQVRFKGKFNREIGTPLTSNWIGKKE